MAINTPCILVVDDDANQRKSLSDALSLEGFEADSFATGKKALAAVEKGDYAAALIDLKLADMSGLDLLRGLKQLSPDVECILLTGYASQESAIEATNLGAYAYFQKPYSVEQLLLSVRRAVEKSNASIALRESEEFHHLISELTSDFVFELQVEKDGSLKRKWMTDSFSRIAGYSLDEMDQLGGWDAIIHPEDRPIRQKQIEALLANKVDVCEFRVVCKDGRIRWLQDYTKPVWDERQNRVTKVYGAAKDITERKQTEIALQLASDTQRQMVQMESASDIHNLIGKILHELLPESIVGVSTLDEEKKAIRVVNFFGGENGLQKIIAKLRFDPAKILYPLKDMTAEDLRLFRSGKLEKYPEGLFGLLTEKVPKPVCKTAEKLLKITGIYTMGFVWQDLHFGGITILARSDITPLISIIEVLVNQAAINLNRLNARDVLIKSEGRFRSLYENSPGPYQSLDAEGKIIEVNNAWLAELGYEREEVIGKWFSDFLSDDQKIKFKQRFLDFKASGEAHAVEFEIKHKNGSQIIISFDGRIGLDENGNFLRTHSIFTNITEQKKSEQEILRRIEQISTINEMGQALAQTMNLGAIFQLAYRYVGELIEFSNFSLSLVNFASHNLEAVFLISDGVEMDTSPLPPLPITSKEKTGRSGALNTGRPIFIDDLEAASARAKNAILVGSDVQPKSALYVPMVVDGKVIGLLEVQSYQKAAFNQENAELLGIAANAIGLAINNGRLFQSLKLQSTALDAAANGIVITDLDGTIEWVNPAFCDLTGYKKEECLGLNPRKLVRSGLVAESVYKELWDTILAGQVWHGTLINHRKDGSLYTEEQTITPLKNEKGEVIKFIGIKQDVTERDQRERELQVIANISAALRTAATREEMLPILLDEMLDQLKIDGIALDFLNSANGEISVELGRGIWAPMTGRVIPPGKGLSVHVLKTGSPYLNNNADEGNIIFMPELFTGCHAAAGVPLKFQDKIIGLIWVASKRLLDDKDIRLLSSVAEIAANAIYRASLHEQTQNKVRQLDTLRTIDQTINSSLDLRVTLSVIVREAPKLIPMDAVAVLIYNPRTLILSFAAGSGFRSKAIEESSVRIGSGLAGKAALERRVINVANLQDSADVFTRKALVEKEGFISYHAVPLIVKSEIQGVLEVFHRNPFKPDEEWEELLATLATQTAIAIDNSAMFTGMQRSNINLTQAYDETIESWAKALELRDKETEGHTRRVVNKALVLARMAGIKDEEIVFFTRGALLHDIGKMAIPDAVLNKPGALSDEEWVLMRAHPKIAFDLLSSIKYLRPALDIPYCHHEKWDGSGYPRGLKGEEIPLAARVFAVVDVYDALTSDRPYRKAWGKEKAQAYIKEQSGQHFDPRAVSLFIKSNSS